MRPLLAFLLLLSCAATMCGGSVTTGIAVAPDASLPTDSAPQGAFAVASDVLAEFGLRPQRLPGNVLKQHGLRACYSGQHVSICDKVLDREVQFVLVESGRRRFSPWADSLRATLLDSLRAQFGAARVRECEWTTPPRQHRRRGCPPPTPGDTTPPPQPTGPTAVSPAP